MKLAAALVFISTLAYAQAPEVPAKMQFAGITLTIRDDARREIQKDVNMLTQSAKHHNIKVERAKTYFPIIEKIFAEERVPDDFKYLVLQESALIADAVSVSNAVGFWQFKDFTAVEMGLRVDKDIDERMNIASSTRAAAQYIKKNNYYFNNWIYALQAYQMGAGGTMKAVKDYQSGTKHMEVNSQTYWYVKKYLAHKIAFEGTVRGTGEVKVFMVANKSKQSISDVAKEFYIDEADLREYNKWIRKEHIPDDKPYFVSIPSRTENKALNEAIAKAETKTTAEQPARITPRTADAASVTMMLHGIPAIKAQAGETPTTLAQRAGVSLSLFLRHNDISVSDRIVADEFYYLKKKKTKGPVSHHVAKAGDNLWSVSQRYGVQVHRLERYNKLDKNSILKEGQVVYLTNKRSAAQPQPVHEAIGVDDAAFNWTVQPKAMPEQETPPLAEPTPEATVPVILPEIPAGKPEEIKPVEETKTVAIDTLRVETVKVETVKPTHHTIAAGETLYAIAKRYEVGVMQLVEWNNLSLTEGIKPGQVIRVVDEETQNQPEAQPTATPETVAVLHTVKTSDTLYSIAREYGVTIKDLMDWNQKKDFNLTIGEKLQILKKQ